ncbi:DUF6492 family protein [Rhodoferax aquaticus]|uniref:Glycosyl transferase n=1 Tax=Rhodoferax aquaticus TaxID=2527691 RepID=A0A515ENQ0_9BURK|nr:DUF6492 family protein [Rhodoferax aquaticus]QDL54297.1 hypothetical protein EXZ61_09020 [Rhodoferax aquaticus]
MNSFVLYCKSYRTDLNRVVRLTHSIREYNRDNIPFYVSVPQLDLALFQEHLQGLNVNLLTDESIITCNPDIDPVKLARIPGNLSQQIVKSEFWRKGVCVSYMCLDSDCIFIRPFHLHEFITADGTPYTIMDEGRDLLYPVLAKRKAKVLEDFQRESLGVQLEFGRRGKHYNFGPNCPIWDKRVWESLAANYAHPRGLSFLDLVLKSANEQRWYGEALLKYKSIELLPSQPFFKMYHYAWQQRFDRRLGIQEKQLERLYCGVVYQSAWEREMDWPSEGGNWLSRAGRRLRRVLNRI